MHARPRTVLVQLVVESCILGWTNFFAISSNGDVTEGIGALTTLMANLPCVVVEHRAWHPRSTIGKENWFSTHFLRILELEIIVGFY